MNATKTAAGIEAKTIKTYFQIIDAQNGDLDDEFLDELLDIHPKSTETGFNFQTLKKRYGTEQFKYEGTPYTMIRYFLRHIQPVKNDVVYDLGSGYGRIVFYGALTTPAVFKGIEIVEERIKDCQRVKTKLGINNAYFSCNNILDEDVSDGNIFFLFNPFIEKTLQQVMEKLKEVAQKRQIKIVSWGGPSTYLLETQDWLEEVKFNKYQVQQDGVHQLSFFVSKRKD